MFEPIARKFGTKALVLGSILAGCSSHGCLSCFDCDSSDVERSLDDCFPRPRLSTARPLTTRFGPATSFPPHRRLQTMSEHADSATPHPSTLNNDAISTLYTDKLDAGVAILSVSDRRGDTAANGNSPLLSAAMNRCRGLQCSGPDSQLTTLASSAGAARNEAAASSEGEPGAEPLHESKRHNRLRLQRLSLPGSSPTRSEVPPTPLALRREGILPRSLPTDSIPIVVARTPSPEQTRRILSERAQSGTSRGLGLAVSVSPGHSPGNADDQPDISYFPALGTTRSPRLLAVNPDAPVSPASTAPPSPNVMRSSAFGADLLRPRTPLSPSHIPGAPALGAGRHGFDWPTLSPPATPTSPSIRAALEEPV